MKIKLIILLVWLAAFGTISVVILNPDYPISNHRVLLYIWIMMGPIGIIASILLIADYLTKIITKDE